MKTFLLPHDIGEILNLLTDSEAGQIIKAVFDYEINSVEPEFSDRTMQIVFFDIKRFLDSSRENYEKVCRQRSEYAKKRWEKHNEVNSNLSDMHEDAQACLSMHKHTAVGNSNSNRIVTVIVILIVIVTVILSRRCRRILEIHTQIKKHTACSVMFISLTKNTGC